MFKGNVVLWSGLHENLFYIGLHFTSGNTQYLGVCRYRTQMHQCQSLAFYLFYHHTQYFLLSLLFFRKKYQSCTILSLFWYWNTLKQDEFVRNLHHDTCTVARLVAGFGTTMFHVLKHSQRIVHQLVTLATVNIDNHSNAAGVVLIRRIIQSFTCLCLLTFCHINPVIIFHFALLSVQR